MKYALKNENGYITHVFDVKDGCDLKHFLEGSIGFLINSHSLIVLFATDIIPITSYP